MVVEICHADIIVSSQYISGHEGAKLGGGKSGIPNNHRLSLALAADGINKFQSMEPSRNLKLEFWKTMEEYAICHLMLFSSLTMFIYS
ncbi:hypothetical protein VNO77_02418 [Canavalia gladiata]|uniref:Uncharacterized protein n=1 Tax=Canavalia gladiata TaxID=3824 RepID=A0AAN9R320_CANGL